MSALCPVPGMAFGSGNRCGSGATWPKRALTAQWPWDWPPGRLQNSTALKRTLSLLGLPPLLPGSGGGREGW